MNPYNVSSGEVWQSAHGMLFVLLDGYETVGVSGNTRYRQAINLDTGKLFPFGDNSLVAKFSKRFA